MGTLTRCTINMHSGDSERLKLIEEDILMIKQQLETMQNQIDDLY